MKLDTKKVLWLAAKVAGGLVAVYLILASIFFSYVFVETSPRFWPNERFSPESWALTSPENRYKLARDLLDGKHLLGSDRQRVIDLLGEPDAQWPGASRYNYTVKNRAQDFWDFNSVYFLQITFDADGTVVQAEIGAD